MAVSWTKEQQKVIDSRGKSLLVSAAAGSGKTAVLVARILSKIMDPVSPVDIDRLLVVTFTNAAASGMRERITKSIEDALKKDPGNTHLQRQSALIHNAQITTIDSFCLQLIRNHFHIIGLEPDFRVADPGELHLIKEEVFTKVIDRFYEEQDDTFLRFSENYSSGKNDDAIKEMVFALYDQARSNPWPQEWLNETRSVYDIACEADLSAQLWYQKLQSDLAHQAKENAEEVSHLIALCQDADGPSAYEEALRDDLAFYRTLSEADTYSSWYDLLLEHTFAKRKSIRNFEGDVKKKDYVSKRRDELKELTGTWKKEFFPIPVAEQIAGIRATSEMYQVLCDLTLAFASAFSEQKHTQHIVDFSDIEHFALRILIDPKTRKPTETALEYRNKFAEVMIDEYQDSNFLQEALLSAVSGEEDGIFNRFMVGDIKQSIYRFRLARPELFLDKYQTYADGDSQDQRERIDLHQNFRSRQEILDFSNQIFANIMHADIGNVEYDDAAALYHGRDDASDPAGDYLPEIILLDSTEKSARQTEKEARMIAARIKKMVAASEIPGLTYGDIVILTRAPSAVSEVYQNVFHDADIPLLIETKTGYFLAREVQQVLALLQVIDQPMQDVPLAAAMKSPFGHFSSEELAKIRIANPDGTFAAAVHQYTGDDPVLAEKIASFLSMLSAYRKKMRDMPIYRLLEDIYLNTDFVHEISALPAGKQRKANLDMLMEKAIAFSKTSYQGLLHFNRYIERLNKYEIDFGEAEVPGEQINAVRFMSIHKSKGLEFPVVFLAGAGKGFNDRDRHNTLLIHPDFGCGLRDINRRAHYKKDTLLRRSLSEDLKKENLGEELRVLYVAMTRAEKKLLITGSCKSDAYEEAVTDRKSAQSGFSKRYQAKSYLDWILGAFCADTKAKISLLGDEDLEQLSENQAKALRTDQNALYRASYQVDEHLIKDIDQAFSWRYPHPDTAGRQQKITVSEIKHRAYEENRRQMEIAPEAAVFEEPVLHPYVPAFMQEEEKPDGARYGTAMHFFLQNLDFSNLPKEKHERGRYIHEQLTFLQNNSKFDPQTLKLLSENKIRIFSESELADRMRIAARNNNLFLEQPFVMSLPAERIWTDTDPETADESEEVLTQGIIDVFWTEEDGIVLLDYKTDRITQAEELVSRYRVQLDLYREALNRRFPDLTVKETWIYSFWLNEAICV